MMFGNRHVLMNDDDGDTGGGGGDDRGFFEQGQVVSVTDRSFQSPGTTGGSINRDESFFRDQSDASVAGGKALGQLVGAVTGIPGLGSGFGRFIDANRVQQVDAQGHPLPNGLFQNGSGDDNSQFQTLSGGGNVPHGSVTIDGATGQVIPGAIGGAVDAELIGLRESIAEQRRQFDIGQENLSPFREAGVGALTQQQALLGLSGVEAQQTAFDQFAESPAQAFLRKRGQKALLANASATGGLGGGNVQKALVEHGIGVAAQQEGEQFNRLAGLSGTGQSTAVTQAQLGQQFAGNVGQLQQGAAQSRASGLLAQEALEQQQASADSVASAARRNQNTALIGALAPAAFDFIGGFF